MFSKCCFSLPGRWGFLLTCWVSLFGRLRLWGCCFAKFTGRRNLLRGNVIVGWVTHTQWYVRFLLLGWETIGCIDPCLQFPHSLHRSFLDWGLVCPQFLLHVDVGELHWLFRLGPWQKFKHACAEGCLVFDQLYKTSGLISVLGWGHGCGWVKEILSTLVL